MLKPRYAILLDGGFIRKKLNDRLGRHPSADDIVTEVARLQQLPEIEGYELLRTYYYDAMPSSAALKLPVSKAGHNLADTARFREAQSLFDHLILKPNFALRMGQVNVSSYQWRLKPSVAKQLLREPRALDDGDFLVDAQQKGVDMRIGMDMARLALREMVRTMIVVTGDSILSRHSSSFGERASKSSSILWERTGGSSSSSIPTLFSADSLRALRR